MQSISIFSRDDYTLALPINSPLGAQGERTSTKRERRHGISTGRDSRPPYLHGARKDFFTTHRYTRIQRLLENYSSNQGADTLIPSSQGISETRREGIPKRRRSWEVTRGFYQPSILWFPEPGEKEISSLSSSKGQSGRALTRLLSAYFSRISEEIYL